MATDDLLPGTYDLTIIRRDTLTRTFSFEQNGIPLVLPLTGWQAQLRSPDASGPVTGTFTVDASDAANGVIVISATPAQVAEFKNGRYDLRLTTDAGATVRTFIRGAVKILGDVSRG